MFSSKERIIYIECKCGKDSQGYECKCEWFSIAMCTERGCESEKVRNNYIDRTTDSSSTTTGIAVDTKTASKRRLRLTVICANPNYQFLGIMFHHDTNSIGTISACDEKDDVVID